MWRDFKGGVYWDELAETCGDISRMMGFRGAARFRGNMVISILTYARFSNKGCHLLEIHHEKSHVNFLELIRS